jgi:hypothetical protein
VLKLLATMTDATIDRVTRSICDRARSSGHTSRSGRASVKLRSMLGSFGMANENENVRNDQRLATGILLGAAW